ncbi:putative phage infection (PIP) family protein YhgE [Pantoea anthophila]|nr:putative phage infection (PIP) family protein YhgE [Pantoea anthophila]
MVKNLALCLLHYLLVFISALTLFTCVGYYLFVFNWNVTMMGKIINGILITLSVTASLGFYWAGHKLRDRH